MRQQSRDGIVGFTHRLEGLPTNALLQELILDHSMPALPRPCPGLRLQDATGNDVCLDLGSAFEDVQYPGVAKDARYLVS